MKRHLPSEFGSHPFYVTPESALGYWRYDVSRVDSFLLSMVRELVKPRMIVWDVGANVGLFSFAAAGLGANVVAIEADPWLAHLMQRSAWLNRLPVTVVPAAASNGVGVSCLYVSESGRASNSVLGEGREQAVVGIPLDLLLDRFPAPELVKIDVEGAELAVLEGAAKALHERPALFCEVTQNHRDVGTLLRRAGYTLYAAREQNRQPIERPSVDTLALPMASGTKMPPPTLSGSSSPPGETEVIRAWLICGLKPCQSLPAPAAAPSPL